MVDRASGISCPPLIIEECEDFEFNFGGLPMRSELPTGAQSVLVQPLDRLNQIELTMKEEDTFFDNLLTDNDVNGGQGEDDLLNNDDPSGTLADDDLLI